MNDIVRLAYMSRSTQTGQGEYHIQAINEQILSEAHTFNGANNISGILCYGNGCYLQVIEGSKSAIELLYTKIEKDHRHKDLKLMFKEQVAFRAFGSWRMKFVEDINIAMPLVRMHGHKYFDPFEFAENLYRDLIEYLSQQCAEGKS